MTAPTIPDLLDPALIADPYGGYDELRERGPVLRGRYLDGSDVWYVTRAADVRAVLGDPRLVNNPASVSGLDVPDRVAGALKAYGVPDDLIGYLTGSMLEADPPDHTRLRKLVSRAFTARRVAQLRPRAEAIAAGLLAGLDGVVDLVETFAYPLPIAVICELVGVPEVDRAGWLGWSRELSRLDPRTLGPVLREIVDHTHDLIDRRRAEPGDDLMTGLIRARDDDGGRLSEVEMVTMVFGLVQAGHETTSNLVANATLALLAAPDQLEMLRAQPSLWPDAVPELMRFCSPVLVGGLRYATTDIEIAGTTLHRGEAVQPVLVSANRDPREYPDPKRLDVLRLQHIRGDGHLGFGHGAHYCLGAALARQEAEVALSALFTRFPGLALATDEPRWLPVPGQRRLAELPVRSCQA